MDANSEAFQILIAGDQTIFLDCLKCLLDAEPGFRIVGEARDGQAAVQLANQLEPDILLLDLSTARISAVSVLQSLATSGSRVRVIVISAGVEGEQIAEAFRFGARGLVLKESASILLFRAMRCVMADQCWIGAESVSDPVLGQSRLRDIAAKGTAPNSYGLTRREMEIVAAVVAGYTNKEIAKQYSVREQTVKHHLTNIFDKIGVFSRLELALFALHHGLIKEPEILSLPRLLR